MTDGGPSRGLARGLTHVLARLEADGVEHIPPDGPVIFVVNHCSLMDGPLLYGLAGRPVRFLVKEEAFIPGLASVLRRTGQIPVHRHRQVDRPAVRAALKVLTDGGSLGIFPEGTRGDGSVRSTRPGVGYFALRTGAPVVPVACHGTPAMVRPRLRRPVVVVRIGRPISFPQHPTDRPLPKRDFFAAAEEVRAYLAELVLSTAPTAAEWKLLTSHDRELRSP